MRGAAKISNSITELGITVRYFVSNALIRRLARVLFLTSDVSLKCYAEAVFKLLRP